MAKYQMTGITKVALVLVLIGGGTFGIRYYLQNHGTAKMVSAVPEAQDQLVQFDDVEPAEMVKPSLTGLPSTTVSVGQGKKIRMRVLPWNAQMGLNLANGGPATTAGSLVEKAGLQLKIERQDDYSKMQEDLVACASELAKGAKDCTRGAHFATIMGDAGPAFFAGLNGQLEKLGPDFKAEIIGAAGYSRGEDAFMAPQNVKDDPQNARGLLVSGVLKDGDWNLAMYWAAQNEICNNPDPGTFDPNCLNWVSTTTGVEAAEKYIQGYCEERPIVTNGKRTGNKQKVCVGATVVWTPSDTAVAKKKGGLVRIWSTKENSSQMACTIVGIKRWNRDNAEAVVALLGAILEGGNQIKTGGKSVLMRAAEASAQIYKEETPAYWARYYKGITEEDAAGNDVQLGGSGVFTLADNVRYFGLEQGTANAYAATYRLFGEITRQQYSADLPSYPPVEDVLNVEYINRLVSSGAPIGKIDEPVFVADADTEVVAKRSWRINFETGSAKFGKGAEKELEELLSTLVIAGDVAVQVEGHTDNVGNAASNLELSRARAAAVETFLKQRAAKNFPEGRLTVKAFGQTKPIESNASPQGRALNRRVDVVLRTVH